MKRKFFAVLFCLFIFAVAVGCSTNEPEIYEPTEPTVFEPYEIITEDEPYEPEEIEEIGEPEETVEPEEPAPPDFSAYPQFHMTILHTNDWHGIMDNVPMYATLVREIRAERENVLLLDGGDIYRRGPLESLQGAAEIAVMNAMGYDALVLGNNEFPRTDEYLLNIADHIILQLAEFPILTANMTLNGEYVVGVDPYIIVTMQPDIEIAIIGVTSPKPWDRNFEFTERYLFECPIAVVARYAEKTSEYTDIQIALSHAGVPIERQMRGVSAIIGADDHRILREPIVIYDGDQRIPLVQAGGERTHYLGQLDLYYAYIDGEWILFDFYGRLLSVEGVEPCEEIQAIIDYYTALIE
ncbi:MAG: metallophosphoesterase [Defluviitaleaceae bacterium]|nr:metallophosphoesterase [Defluviitaleaceae bacterium]